MTPKPRFARMAKEFPDFDQDSLPEIPPGFADESWRQEACPCFSDYGRGEVIYIYSGLQS